MLQANEGISGWKFFHPTHCNKVGSSPLFLTGCVNAREPWAKCIHLPNVGVDSLPLHLTSVSQAASTRLGIPHRTPYYRGMTVEIGDMICLM